MWKIEFRFDIGLLIKTYDGTSSNPYVPKSWISIKQIKVSVTFDYLIMDTEDNNV